MKKKLQPFGMTIFILLIFFLLFNNNLNSIAYGNKPSNDEIFLKYENYRLRNNLRMFEERLKITEDVIKKINEYDNIVYSQILGIDTDTSALTENEYKNIDYSSAKYDTIFSDLDERTLFASKLMADQLIKKNNLISLLQKDKNMMNYYPTISPIKTDDIIKISSGFGWRKHPIYRRPIFHEGVDIDTKKYVNVYSTADGYVEKIKYSRVGYGNCIVIKHNYGLETLYAHLSSIKVSKKGQFIKKGQIIGTVGSTGLSTGPHLHYEVSQNNQKKDPLAYFYTYLTEELLANNQNY